MNSLIFKSLMGEKLGKLADGESVNFSTNISKNNALQDSRAAFCGAECGAISGRKVPVARALPQHITRRQGTELSMAERPNRRGELPVAVVICDRTGRGRAVYPGRLLDGRTWDEMPGVQNARP